MKIFGPKTEPCGTPQSIQVEVCWCATDVDDLGSVGQIWGKPGESWVGDVETMTKNLEEQLMVHRIEGGGQV